jgi:hypothetical protein
MNVGIPPRSLNHRLPAAEEAPTASAASSLLNPLAISHQNPRSMSRRCIGCPGDFIGALPVNSCIHPAGLPIHTSIIKVLQGPVESSQYPAISKLWENAWSEFIPFLDYDVEIRRVICSTNAIESINARYRRAVRARGHFPNDTAALKCLYLVTRSLDPTGRGRARWAMRWKPALNAFAITFQGRIN